MPVRFVVNNIDKAYLFKNVSKLLYVTMWYFIQYLFKMIQSSTEFNTASMNKDARILDEFCPCDENLNQKSKTQYLGLL